MNRPYVICHMQASIDGRISGKFFFTPAAEAVYEKDNEIRKSYQTDAVMNGAVTCGEIYSDGFLQPGDLPDASGCPLGIPDDDPIEGGSSVCSWEDFIAEPCFGRYIVCVDPKGTLRWNKNTVSHRGNPKAHVIEILTEDVDSRYPAYLKARGISFIFAGEAELDLALALSKLQSSFGIQRILLTGGGQMNWTFLKAGCIDEINLIILPMIDGNTSSAGLFDRPPGGGGCSKQDAAAFAFSQFRLAEINRLPEDSLWLKYIPFNTSL
ncbi:MAG: hypothetical protein E7221_03375 [Clostridiales bacterium]|nr:hypothetical protein [Clostridiales bacterium]